MGSVVETTRRNNTNFKIIWGLFCSLSQHFLKVRWWNVSEWTILRGKRSSTESELLVLSSPLLLRLTTSTASHLLLSEPNKTANKATGSFHCYIFNHFSWNYLLFFFSHRLLMLAQYFISVLPWRWSLCHRYTYFWSFSICGVRGLGIPFQLQTQLTLCESVKCSD